MITYRMHNEFEAAVNLFVSAIKDDGANDFERTLLDFVRCKEHDVITIVLSECYVDENRYIDLAYGDEEGYLMFFFLFDHENYLIKSIGKEDNSGNVSYENPLYVV